MAGTLVEIWLTVSALSSLAILFMAIGYSDLRIDRRFRPVPARKALIRRRRLTR